MNSPVGWCSPIHESSERLLYLALCWQSHNYISTRQLILAIDMWIVYRIRLNVCYLYASSKWFDVNPWSRDTTVLLSGTPQWWCGRISIHFPLFLIDWYIIQSLDIINRCYSRWVHMIWKPLYFTFHIKLMTSSPKVFQPQCNTKCCCKETPSTARRNQEYFYLHFIQELFSKKVCHAIYALET